MANTTNFNWETPDDTDLVKDGAAAIRTLGNSIDTSFVDLKGGTTNQVLAKNSNTDLDFKWVADASGIPATIFDAKGDLIAATAADTAARLGVGANGTVLTADSAEATGLKWAAPSAGANWSLVNSGGTSLSGSATTVSGISGADKIMVIVAGASTTTTQSEIQVRVNSLTTSSYYRSGFYIFSGPSYNAGNFSAVGGLSNGVEVGMMSTNSGSTVAGAITITGCNSSGVKQYIAGGGCEPNGGNSQNLYSWQGYIDTTDVITSITIRIASGTFDAGSVFVYRSA